MPRGIQTSKRKRILPPSMRSGRSSARFASPATVTLVFTGLVLGFAATMCIQSLSTVPPSTSSQTENCLKARSRRVAERTLLANSEASQILPWPSLTPKSSRNLILVGVMTAQKFVDSRAWTVWRTWAQMIPGRVLFFVSEKTKSKHPDLPLIPLPGVDDSYPPQKKSYMMLRWMVDHALDDFQWFIRADDDVYIRGDKLEILLRSLNSSKPWYLGQAGLGTPEEYGQLSLGRDDNYCMGGPGVVFSRETLRQVRPHIPFCLRNMYTTHEDVEIGRCIRKFVGVTCSWSYEMQTIFYNNQSGVDAYTGDLNVGEVHQAITLHPVKKPLTMKRLHNFARKLKTSDLRFRSLQLSRDVLASIKELIKLGKTHDPGELAKFSDFGHPPSLLRFVPETAKEVPSWDFLSPTIMFCNGVVNCPRHNSPSFLRYALADAVRQAVDIMNRYARQRGRVLLFQDVLYAYRRVDPVHGADYVVDMLLLYRKFKGRKVSVPVRRHAYIQQSFGNLEIVGAQTWRRIQREVYSVKKLAASVIGMSDSEDDSPVYSGGSGALSHLVQTQSTISEVDNQRIHVILPLAGRAEPFRRFLVHYERVCLRNPAASGPMALIVVLFPAGNERDTETVRSLMNNLRLKYPDESVRWIDIEDMEFSRGFALSRGAELVTPESLVFFTDVDIMFDEFALYRLRQNTVRGVQVNFPIVFSEYTPAVIDNQFGHETHFQYDSRSGYFRHFGYGLASLYRSDLDASGGLETGISGWGLEDVNLFEKCFKKGNFTIFRAPEPSLIHVYHPVVCDKKLSSAQYEMCLGSRAQSYASIEYLADRVYSDQNYRLLIRRRGS